MTREKGDISSIVSVAAAIGTLVIVLLIGAALYRQDRRDQNDVHPRDVFAELQAVKSEIVQLRESVNHQEQRSAEAKKEADRRAAETKEQTDALAKSLNEQIAAMKRELMELNGKK